MKKPFVKQRFLNRIIKSILFQFVLALIFSGYTLANNIITVKTSFEIISKDKIDSQNIITGNVIGDHGLPLVGVTVQIKKTSKTTNTDIGGKYSIVASNKDILVFSYIGFKTQEIAIADQTTIDVVLESDLDELFDEVIVGYGKQKKTNLLGAVSSIKGEELVNIPVINFSQALAGRIPGVFVSSNGGEPGVDGTTIRIRGINTFGDTSPLIVVDGVPGRSLERIDPNTIESLSVLKDASAAIYGAQAANGVILITTKRGDPEKFTIKLSHNQGYAKPTKLPKLTNAAEYATLLNEIDKYNGVPERYTADEIQKYRDGSDPWLYPNTDWYKETLKSWSVQASTNLSISGGNEKNKYFVAVSKKDQDGFYKNSAAEYKQYDFKSNLDFNINKYLDLYVNLTGRMEDRNFPSSRTSGEIFRSIIRQKPTLPAYWPNGLPGPDVELGNNPVVISTKATGYTRDKWYTANSDFGFNLKIPGVEGLSLKGNASYDKNFRFSKTWQIPWSLYTWDRESYDINGDPVLVEGQKGISDPRLSEVSGDHQRILTSAILNYNRTFSENHTVDITAGAEKFTHKGDSFSAFRRYFVSKTIDQLFAGGKDEIDNDGSGYEIARLNYFGRVNYSYKEKYLAEFLWRYQGSYIFESSSRYGFFPGFSLGYVISNEDFWQKISSVVDFAKLRTSFGTTGNDLIAPFQYLTTYSLNNLSFINNGGGTFNSALYEGVLPNKGVTWETAKQFNIGVDLRLFKEKLTVSTDYFYYSRSDILGTRNASVPSTAGLILPSENIGKFKNSGFDFSIDYKNNINYFNYGIGLNGVFAKNEIVFWDEAPDALDYQQSTGKPIGAGLYYQAIGIFKDQAEIDAADAYWSGARPGDIIFKDYNGDGVIDGNDRVRNDKSSMPKFTGGLNFDFAYKGFDLSILFQGAMGGIFYETTESGNFANYLKSFYDNRWTEENPNSNYPRTYDRETVYWINQPNTFWIHKTDYIRLKNIELGYTLPNSFTNKYSIDNFRLFVNAFNLATYSPDMKDYDPENIDGRGYNYPLNKVVNFGLNITF